MRQATAMKQVRTTRPGDDARLKLEALLRLFVTELGRIRDDHPEAEKSLPSLMQWSDEENIYLEVELEGSPPLEADISLLGSRVFIRTGRTDETTAPRSRSRSG
jgi:hypothetical protein